MAGVAVMIAGLVGLTVGVVAMLVLLRRPASRRPAAVPADPRERLGTQPADTLLDLLPTAAVLVDRSGGVRLANRAARELLVVRRGLVADVALRDLVRDARRFAAPLAAQITLTAEGFPHRTVVVGARAEPLADGQVALLADDLTESTRLEAVRRDFVDNVGHEIKTPVGALTILTEAALEAQDDPDAVRRFLGRLQHEARRLSRLVQELLDLSRLQGGEPLPVLADVPVDLAVEEAVDRVRPVADAKQIALVVGGDAGAVVAGDEAQLVTALANLLDNAVAYSPDGTRVAVGVRRREDAVEVSVSDEGIGIAADDVERIFERFYRVDPARSRETGGTGLGLAIVKHVVGNHGGEISVWSRPGEGSTFTLRLPVAAAPPTDAVDRGAPVAKVEQP
jgi:two-component system sensor histidine kinase SenX3